MPLDVHPLLPAEVEYLKQAFEPGRESGTGFEPKAADRNRILCLVGFRGHLAVLLVELGYPEPSRIEESRAGGNANDSARVTMVNLL